MLGFLNNDDQDVKKVIINKTTLHIILLFYKFEVEGKEIISTDKFLDQNYINASRSKKITILFNLLRIFFKLDDLSFFVFFFCGFILFQLLI